MKYLLIVSSIALAFAPHNTRNSSDKHSGSARYSLRNTPGPVGTVSIVIDKSDYELSVYDDKGWYATFPVVFGNNSLDDKRYEGDKNTPEGTFRITHKKLHDKWSRFLALDYPTKDSWEKFNSRKQKGEIPKSASIGGGIGIHGTWPHEDFVIDRYKNWTLGCISMKNTHVLEIYSYTPVGTQVRIKK
ncbi:MAG: murein L,D-transpeptidase family protein [Chitinophagaceae bacterium]